MRILLSNASYMVATGQKKVREKRNFSRSGKSQGIFIFRENRKLEKSQGKVTFVEDQYPVITCFGLYKCMAIFEEFY